MSVGLIVSGVAALIDEPATEPHRFVETFRQLFKQAALTSGTASAIGRDRLVKA